MKMPRLCLALGGLFLLGGCLSGALRGGKPDELYRFGSAGGAAAGAEAGGVVPRLSLTFDHFRFSPEISSDRLLAVQDNQSLYIKGVRWIAPAPDLFVQGLDRTFQARAPDVRVTQRQETDPSAYTLDIEITRFEARYDGGFAGNPSVMMEGTATLHAPRDRHVVAFRHFSASAAAVGRQAPAVTSAFDQANSLFSAQVVDWTRLAMAG
ncbi:ABC-type transport auxiliary lipoprotein family protein [Sphingomonas oryzagri]